MIPYKAATFPLGVSCTVIPLCLLQAIPNFSYYIVFFTTTFLTDLARQVSYRTL